MKRPADNSAGSSPDYLHKKSRQSFPSVVDSASALRPLLSVNHAPKNRPRNDGQKCITNNRSDSISTHLSQQVENHPTVSQPIPAHHPTVTSSTLDLLDVTRPVIADSAEIQLDTSRTLTKKAKRRLRKAQRKADSALDLQPGCVIAPNNVYTPLSMLTPDTSGINVIGVVTHLAEVKTTKTGDLWCSVGIVDPSNFDTETDFGPVDGKGFKVNCFTASYPGWLPCPKNNDIVILRNIKVSEFKWGINAVGYKDKMQWAIYDPETGGVHHGDKGGAPDSEGLGGGFGYPFGPFYEACQHEELLYCRRLVDWWNASLSIVQSKLGFIHQIEANSYSVPLSNLPRCHRLISEASPCIQPKGFMDCTVEVLKVGKMNPDKTVDIFVTDYSFHPHVGDFFSAEFADRVMKIEMNDAAADFEKEMKSGEYWFLRNTRIKLGFRSGLLEGRLREKDGVRKLDPNDLMSEPHFEALLRRKEEWEIANRSSDGGSNHLLLEDATEDNLFDCTVEVVNTEFNPISISYLHITDYTAVPGAPALATAARGELDARILKVALSHEQAEMAQVVERGFYTILKLRLQKIPRRDGFWGRLGGDDRVIHKLNPNESNNQYLKALIQRKEDWMVHQGQRLGNLPR